MAGSKMPNDFNKDFYMYLAINQLNDLNADQ